MTPPADIQASDGSTRLRGIDALRGAAALAVVLYHSAAQTPGGGDAVNVLSRALGAAVRFAAGYGYVGVFLFFVISGFCIHLNYAKARAAGRDQRIAFLPFWRRRVRRLYPPYLVAFFLSLAMMAATVGLPPTRLFAWDVASHLLMLHNFDPRTCYSISSVFWTLAVEEQLYLAYFPLLFVRRRWGWAATLVCCFAARAAWYAAGELSRAAAGVEIPVAESAAVHWFTWGLGALAVEGAFGVVTLPRWTRDLRVGALALLAAAALAHVQDARDVSRPLRDIIWLLLHPAWGCGFFILINRVVAAERGWARRPGVARRGAGLAAVSVAAGLAAVGVVSYSLYLTHPLVLLLAWRFEALPLPPLVISLLVLTPLCLAFAWLFFQLFERPFMSRPAARPPRVEAAPDLTAPAPPPARPAAAALPAEIGALPAASDVAEVSR